MSPKAQTIRQLGQPTQDFVPIKEIRDGVVILKGSGLRLVLLVSSINFSLKSADEQEGILLQFQNFLNALDFPLQMFIQSRRLDIRPYLTTLEERLGEQTSDLMKIQIREYIEFVKKFTESTDIMTKGFFVVIPYDPPILRNAKSTGFFSRFFPNKSAEQVALAEERFEEYRMQLEQRAGVVAQGFARMGLRVIQLGTEELVELYFKMFNPGETDTPQF